MAMFDARPSESAIHDPLHVLDFGPQYEAADTSGVITIEPPKQGEALYGVLVHQVNEDGNDIGGARGLHLQVPIGTYTGWNLGRRDRFEDRFCSLQGSFIPFARTKQERLDTGDPRLSMEERYPTKDSLCRSGAEGSRRSRFSSTTLARRREASGRQSRERRY